MLLLALIAVGVAAMHIIGHGGMDAGGRAVARDGNPRDMHASVTAPMKACHGSCSAPSAACLFIVTTAGLMLVIALAMSFLRRTTDQPVEAGVRLWPASRRAPPPRWAIGLQLADLSVLRT